MSAVNRPSAAIFAGTDRPSPAAGAATHLSGMFRDLMRALVNRRQLVQLRDLSDRGLADIGLMRLDLHFAGRMPLNVDPTLRLATTARERLHSPRIERR